MSELQVELRKHKGVVGRKIIRPVLVEGKLVLPKLESEKNE